MANKILRCPVCKHRITRKPYTVEEYEMIAYICDPERIRKCGFAIGVLDGGQKPLKEIEK
jgi:hypothetical protein